MSWYNSKLKAQPNNEPTFLCLSVGNIWLNQIETYKILNKILKASWSSQDRTISSVTDLHHTIVWIVFCVACWPGIKKLCRKTSEFPTTLDSVSLLQWCECTSFLPVGSRSGWSGQFCVTDVPAGVSSQHSKPSHISPQNIPQGRKKKKV